MLICLLVVFKTSAAQFDQARHSTSMTDREAILAVRAAANQKYEQWKRCGKYMVTQFEYPLILYLSRQESVIKKSEILNNAPYCKLAA